MCSAPVLAYYDASRPTELWTDASDGAIGGALLQRDEKGAWRPVGYYSRRLSASEVKYGVYHKELLAIRDCLLAFRYYLVGISFVCKTDHHSIQWLLDQKELSGLQTRWLGVLQSFNIREIQYVPGERNVLADALSRHPDPDGESFEHLIPDTQLGIPIGPSPLESADGPACVTPADGHGALEDARATDAALHLQQASAPTSRRPGHASLTMQRLSAPSRISWPTASRRSSGSVAGGQRQHPTQMTRATRVHTVSAFLR